MTPQITTIILTFKRPRLVVRALRSALAQTYRRIRVCVYDDASNDETERVVANIAANDSRVEYYQHATNIGAVANYAFALNRVATPYFSMLSDDDILAPELYERAMDGFARHPLAGCFCARTVVYEVVKQHLFAKPTSWSNGYHEPSVAGVELMVQDHFPATGVVFRKQVLTALGELNQFASDYVYMAQAINAFPIVVSDYEGGVFTVHPASYTGRRSLRLSGPDAAERSADGTDGTEEWLLFFLTTLLALPGRNATDKMRLFTSAYDLAGRALFGEWVCALIAGREEESQSVVRELHSFRMPFKLRAVLSLANLMPFSVITALMRSLLRAHARVRASRATAVKWKVRDYLKELEGGDQDFYQSLLDNEDRSRYLL